MHPQMRHNIYSTKPNHHVPCPDANGNLRLPANLPHLNTTSYESMESNTSFIDKITWPNEPLPYRHIHDACATYAQPPANDDDTDSADSADSLLSSVDTNELLGSHTNLDNIPISAHAHAVQAAQRSHQPSIYSDEELPALPLSARSQNAKRHRITREKTKSVSQQIYSKKQTTTYIPAVSSYFYHRNNRLQTVNDDEDAMIEPPPYELHLHPPNAPLDNSHNNMMQTWRDGHHSINAMHKHKSMPYETKSGASYIIRNSTQRLAKTPNKINSGKKLKKRGKKKNAVLRELDLEPLHTRIPPQIDPLDTHSQSPPVPPIPALAPNTICIHLAPLHAESASPAATATHTHTKSTTFEYDHDYDCDVEPVPTPASMQLERIQPFALTKENIDRLNNNNNNNNNLYAMTDSTSSEESDDLESLEKIGKQLREINIVNSSGDLSLLVQPNSNINSTPITPPLHHDLSDPHDTCTKHVYFKHFESQSSLQLTGLSNVNKLSNETTTRLSITVTPHTGTGTIKHVDTRYLSDDFDDNSDEVASKYLPQPTESTLVTPIRDDTLSLSITPIKFDAQPVQSPVLNRQVLPLQMNTRHHHHNNIINENNKPKIKQNKKHSVDFNDVYRSKKQYINDSIILDENSNDDAGHDRFVLNMRPSTTPIAYDEEEKQMDFNCTIYNHNSAGLVVHDRNSANTTKTETYANSVDLEEALTFIHELHQTSYNQRSEARKDVDSKSLSKYLSTDHLYSNPSISHHLSPRSEETLLIPIDDDEEEFLPRAHKRSLHVRNRNRGSNTDIIDIGEHTTDSDDDDMQQPRLGPMIDRHSDDTLEDIMMDCIPNRKVVPVSFSVRRNHSWCLHLWIIAFHFISLVCYLSAGYVYYIYYKFGGMTYELLCCAMLTLIILFIYIGIVMKNSSSSSVSIHRIIFGRDYRYNSAQYMVNSGRKKRVRVIRCMVISSMINCTHFLLQLVIYMYLWDRYINNIIIWNVFEPYELYALVTVILLQCIGLSMTIINVIAYVWERKHYHSQSLSLRVLCLYLDMVRISFLLYIFWSLTDKVISSFYYLYFYVEYWLLFLLLVTVRYVLICFNWNALYRKLGFVRFLLYWLYSLIELVFRFIVIQLFPHCGVYYMIHNVGTGKFDHYIANEKHLLFCGQQMVSIKKSICDCNFYSATMSRHIQLLQIFEFIENGVYEYMQNDAFLLSVDVKQEILRRILTINYQLFMADDDAYDSDDGWLQLNLNNIILYEFHRMVQLAVYPVKIMEEESNKQRANDGDTRHKIYDDIFQHGEISKSSIFMEWFIRNELMANLHFEWNNGFTVDHALFTTLFCKYVVSSFYIFSRITNICWLYFMMNNCVMYLLNTNFNISMVDDTRWLLMYIFAVILVLQIVAHITLVLLAIDAYNFERSIWFLLPMVNAKYIHKMLNPRAHKHKKGDHDRYSVHVETAVDVYENMCSKHIVSNYVCDIVGFTIGAVIISYI